MAAKLDRRALMQAAPAFGAASGLGVRTDFVVGRWMPGHA